MLILDRLIARSFLSKHELLCVAKKECGVLNQSLRGMASEVLTKQMSLVTLAKARFLVQGPTTLHAKKKMKSVSQSFQQSYTFFFQPLLMSFSHFLYDTLSNLL
jgi:hypothetical protein